MKKWVRERLLGISIAEEYVCARYGDVAGKLSCGVFFNEKWIDLTHRHLFLGYKPVVIALTATELLPELALQKKLTLHFHTGDPRQPAAVLALSPLAANTEGFLLYEGVYGTHSFEKPHHRFFTKLRDKLRPAKAGNVNLPGNLYDQVKIAYSLPREICLITLGAFTRYNLFPTDLHGRCENGTYLISLRHAGKACRQAEEYQELALWRMPASMAGKVYSFAKNHMRDPVPAQQLPLTAEKSLLLRLPMPENALSVEELKLVGPVLDVGIHRLLLFKTKDTVLKEDAGRLVHLHRSYVQWAVRGGLRLESVPR